MASHATRALGLVLPLALAERFDLRGSYVPSHFSLHTLHAFYVYAEAPLPWFSSGPASVSFHRLGLDTERGGWTAAALPGIIQVTLIPYAEFWQVVNPKHFCCNDQDVAFGRCSAVGRLLLHFSRDGGSLLDEEPGVTRFEVDELLAVRKVHNHSVIAKSENYMARVASVVTEHAEAAAIFSQIVPASPASSTRRLMHRSGVYVLVVSNCGSTELPGATLTGEVVVRNPFGHLPGSVWPLLPLSVVLVHAHGCMACLWGAKLLCWRGTLFEIQRLLSWVLGIALLAAFAQFAFYAQWNSSGSSSAAVHGLVYALMALAKLSTWVLLLVASLGWGLTRPQLGKPLRITLGVLGTLYLATHINPLGGIRIYPAKMLFWLSGQVLDVGFLFSIFCALCRVMRTLKEQQQLDRFLMFQRLRCVLVFSLLVALVAVGVEVVLHSWMHALEWKWGWTGPAVAQLLTLMIHACMVYLWAPNKYSQADSQRAVALLPVEAQADAAAGPQVEGEARLQWQEMKEPMHVQQGEATPEEQD